MPEPRVLYDQTQMLVRALNAMMASLLRKEGEVIKLRVENDRLREDGLRLAAESATSEALKDAEFARLRRAAELLQAYADSHPCDHMPRCAER